MTPHCGWLTTLYFTQIVRAASADVSSTDAGSSYNATYNYRSVWSILGSCGFTLLICVWHAIYPVLSPPGFKQHHVFLLRLSLILLAFLAPEVMISVAFAVWLKARGITKRFLDHGYKWWTMTHSHFVMNGGFALHDGSTTRLINDEKFLRLVKAGDIVNPVLLERDIKDRSTSDGLGKAILIIQLIWFGTQLIVRLANHLPVTLVELDTLCMALLTFPLLFFWWKKPRSADCPHVFYTHNAPSTANPDDESASDERRHSWKEVSKILETFAKERGQGDVRNLVIPDAPQAGSNSAMVSLLFFLSWSLFGGLHVAAWNYEFPTGIEKILWRVSSLTLTGLALFGGFLALVSRVMDPPDSIGEPLAVLKLFNFFVGIICRLILMVLMLASLRSLPPSTHVVISWTNFIPHI